MGGIDNSHDYRNDASIRVLKRLARAVALPVHEHGVTDSGLGVVKGDEGLIQGLVLKSQRLDDQEPPVLVVPVADCGYHCTDDFSQNHCLKPSL